MAKLWGGRFKKKPHSLMEKFTSSLDHDKRLAEFDCLGSIAHAEMLAKCRIISRKDSSMIVSGLKSILNDVRHDKLKYNKSAEDIHTAIQEALYKKIGKPAATLHTARSRNDQVSLDTRMYCKKEIDVTVAAVKDLKKSMLAFAKKNINVIVPGFTHLQNAQPVLLAHQMLAYCQMLDRDMERLSDCKKRVDVMPLGSCAISGTALAIDRNLVAKKLGFSKVSSNSMDAVSDRDFIIEVIFALSLIAMHLSRISEDFIILNSPAFGLIEIEDEICTGSSMMPQKKNPDVLELVRGKSGELYGALISVLTVMKGLPLTYNRDMQEDKGPLFRAIDTVKASLGIMELFFKDLKVDKKKIEVLLRDETLYATDIMEYLVKKGVALKEAHDSVGKVVRYCASNKLNISEVPLNKLRSFNSKFDKRVYDLLCAERSVNLKDSLGGTSLKQVRRQILNA
ncbi:MAG: argininosuccinate lyase [Candidatus Omnitrophica bacterium]|nr:argininosuccinate lyase [Candidatus Omnitrophota bacterium]